MPDDYCCDTFCNKRAFSHAALVWIDLLFYLWDFIQYLAFAYNIRAEYAGKGYKETDPCLYEIINVSYSDPLGYQKPSACSSDRYEAEPDLLSCLRIQRLLFLS